MALDRRHVRAALADLASRNENARFAAGALVGRAGPEKSQEGRRRANPRPRSPRPKRVRLAGSGTPIGTWLKSLVIEFSSEVGLQIWEVLSTRTLPTPGPNMISAVPPFITVSDRPFIVVVVVTAGTETSTPSKPITMVLGAAAVTVKSKLTVPGEKNVPSLSRVTAKSGPYCPNSTTADDGAPVMVKLLNVSSPIVQVNPAAITVPIAVSAGHAACA